MNDNGRNFPAKDVLLLLPPLNEHLYGEGWRFSESPTVPLGLMYLATPLIKAGYHVNFIDLTVDRLEKDQYFNLLKNPDFILISCYTQSLKNTVKIIHDIRNVNHRAYIICGGHYCTDTGKHVEGSDMTVFGEADLYIVKILDLVGSKRSLSNIPGLSYKKNGRLVRNPGFQLVEDLDLVDPPSFDLVRNKQYGYLYGIRVDAMMPIITSRGCPFHCSFCTFQGVSYRERKVKPVIEEIKMRVQEGARLIIFYDDNFLLRRTRVIELLDRIIEQKYDLKLVIAGRVDLADLEIYRKLKEAGVIIVLFGIESANQDVLNFYKKRTTVGKIKTAVINANKAGILTYGNLIIGSPIEGLKHFEINRKILKKLPLDFLNVHILDYIYPSPLWHDAHKRGLIKENEYKITANEKLCGFSREELIKMQEKLIRTFYNNPKRILRLMYKLSRNLGLGYIITLIKLFYTRSIYRSAERFHDSAIAK